MTHAIEYRLGFVPGPTELGVLRRHADESEAGSDEAAHRSVTRSSWVATAWDGSELVGLVRVLTDEVWVAFVLELLVHPEYHHQGVGKELIDRYEQAFGHVRHQWLVTDVEWVQDKFLKRGFHKEPGALTRQRPLA